MSNSLGTCANPLRYSPGLPRKDYRAGPVLRFDHHPPPPGFYPTIGTGGLTVGGGSVAVGNYGSPYTGVGLTVGLPLDDYPDMSLTAGGFAEAGVDVRLGADRDYSLTMSARYDLVRFPEDNRLAIPICQTGTFVLSDQQPLMQRAIFLPLTVRNTP